MSRPPVLLMQIAEDLRCFPDGVTISDFILATDREPTERTYRSIQRAFRLLVKWGMVESWSPPGCQ